MLLKPIEKGGKPKELPENARFKIIFLLIMLVIGALVITQATRLQNTLAETTKDFQEQINPEPTVYVSLNELKDEGEDLIGESTKKGQEVLGEATKIATKPAELAQDYVYEITIEEMIKKLYLMLPERRRGVILDELSQ